MPPPRARSPDSPLVPADAFAPASLPAPKQHRPRVAAPRHARARTRRRARARAGLAGERDCLGIHMINFDFELLSAIGLSEALARRARDAADAERDAGTAAALALMRVTAVHRTTVQLHDGRAVRTARVLQRLLRGDDGAPALAVGDWALATADAAGDLWVRARVEPTSHIARRDGDGSRHPIASNVDCALLVMGLDDDFNLRRLERYLSLVLASGVAPVVVLSKADIAAADPRRRDAHVAQLRARLPPGVEVVIVDGTDPRSAASFAHLIGFGRTLVVLGSSGAGKSTLT